MESRGDSSFRRVAGKGTRVACAPRILAGRHIHSVRKATMGSTLAARRAGSQAARKATAEIRSTIPPKVSGSAAPTPKSRLFSNRVAANAPSTPTTDADRDERHRLPDDEAEDGGLRRAQRHANADLVRALRDRVSHHAVNPDRGEEKRGRGEDRKQERVEARPGERRVRCIPQRLLHSLGEYSDRPSANCARTAEVRLAAFSTRVRTTSEVIVERNLRQRQIHLRRVVIAQRAVFHVPDHADDLAHQRLLIAGAEAGRDPFADRVLPREKLAREELVHDHDRRRFERVVLVEDPPLRARDADGLEVVGRDDPRWRGRAAGLPAADAPRCRNRSSCCSS